MYKILIGIVFALCCVPFINAQDEYHKFEVYGGYSRDISSDPNLDVSLVFNSRQAGNGEPKSFQGFNASATYNFSKYIGAKVDYASHFSTGTIQAAAFTGNAGGNTKESRSTIQGGIQIKNNSKEARFKPFGHALAGRHRQSVKIDNTDPNTLLTYGSDKFSSSGFATTFGGGLDIRLSKRIDVRVAQFNYTINFVNGKTLASSPGIGNSPYVVAIQSEKQNQYTFGFGVVFH